MDFPGLLFDGFLILFFALWAFTFWRFFRFIFYFRKHHNQAYAELTRRDVYGIPFYGLEFRKFIRGDEDLGDPKLGVLKRSLYRSQRRVLVLSAVLGLILIFLVAAVYFSGGFS